LFGLLAVSYGYRALVAEIALRIAGIKYVSKLQISICNS